MDRPTKRLKLNTALSNVFNAVAPVARHTVPEAESILDQPRIASSTSPPVHEEEPSSKILHAITPVARHAVPKAESILDRTRIASSTSPPVCKEEPSFINLPCMLPIGRYQTRELDANSDSDPSSDGSDFSDSSDDNQSDSDDLDANSDTLYPEAGSDEVQTPDNELNHYQPLDGRTVLSKLILASHDNGRTAHALESFLHDHVAQQHNVQLDHRLHQVFSELKVNEPGLWPKKDNKSPEKPSDDIEKYDGPTESQLCVLLHYPTFNKAIHTFWDEANPCIEKVMAKRLNANNAFGFDLHWRRESAAQYRILHNRYKCPRSEYPPAVIRAHDHATFEVLALIPADVILLAGECVYKSYKKRLRSHREKLKLVEIKVDLFQDGKPLKCLITVDDSDREGIHLGRGIRLGIKVSHPEYLFKAGIRNAANADSAYNLAMYLSNIESNHDYFSVFARERVQIQRATDLTAQLRAMIQLEREEQRVIPLSEYHPGLVAWFRRKWPQINVDALQSSDAPQISVAGTIASQITLKNKISHFGLDREIVRDFKRRDFFENPNAGGWEASRGINESRAYEWNHGRMVRLKRNNKSTLYLVLGVVTPDAGPGNIEKLFLQFARPPGASDRPRVQVLFEEDRLVLIEEDNTVILSRTYEEIKHSAQGPAFVRHALLEYANRGLMDAF